MLEISKEKRDWMESIGMKEFDKPMKFYVGEKFLYSEDYIRNTSLEVLKEKYEARLIRDVDISCDDEN